jgi:predicted dehydrogenase
MGVSVARAEAIIEAGRQGHARCMVGYMKRYDSGNLLLKEHLDSWREAGERVLLARNHGFGGNWTYGQDANIPEEGSDLPKPPGPDEYPPWLPERWRCPYLGYLQQWTHNLNLLRFFLNDTGGETTVMSVQLDRDGMTGLVVLDTKGARAVVESAYSPFHAWDEHTQIYTDGGWLRAESPPLLHKEQPASVRLYRAAVRGRPPRYIEEVAPPAWSYREEARHFLSCVRTGEPFRSSAEDTLHDVRLCESIYRQFIGK